VLLPKSATREKNGWELTGGQLEAGNSEHFLDAIARESFEEISVSPDPSECDIIAMLQQRVSIPQLPDHYVAGMVVLYACHSTVEDHSLTLQKSEVSDAKWWRIEDAIMAKDEGGSEEFVFLAHRRMLAIFFNAWSHHSGKIEIYTGNLSDPVKVRLEYEGGMFNGYI
jgi:8-oxo-dGTP pyrophosphatase MutT (NUDIX family)